MDNIYIKVTGTKITNHLTGTRENITKEFDKPGTNNINCWVAHHGK